jgi:hypothetical protein
MLDRPSANIAFSSGALKANLARLKDEFEDYQACRDRDAIYRYLNAVFELVTLWNHERRAVDYARRALSAPRRHPVPNIADPFAAIIACTSDPKKVDYRTRSKWSRVLRYAAEYYDSDESLTEFIKRKGGINRCAARFTRRLGRGVRSGD